MQYVFHYNSIFLHYITFIKNIKIYCWEYSIFKLNNNNLKYNCAHTKFICTITRTKKISKKSNHHKLLLYVTSIGGFYIICTEALYFHT